MATIESRITELERQHGGADNNLVRVDSESYKLAKEQLDLIGWPDFQGFPQSAALEQLRIIASIRINGD